MKSVSIIAISLFIIGASAAILEKERTRVEEDTCPSSETCSGCGLNWNVPSVTEDQVPTGDDLCTVTLMWDWPFDSSYDGADPRLVFYCSYENGDPCNLGNENICASCEQIVLTGIHPSKTPSISYSDTCGNTGSFDIAENCEERTTTNQPTIDITNQPTTESYSTSEIMEESTTSFGSTSDMWVGSESSTDYYESTTSRSYFCPSLSECSDCPSEWEVPTIYEEGLLVSEDSCNIDLFWDSELSGSNGGPRLGFTCIYGNTGEYCKPSGDFVCASCESLTLYDINPSLNPFISYTDTCGFTNQFAIGKHCIPAPYCPESDECSGCHSSWTSPSFEVKGGPTHNGTCDISILWEWEYSSNDSDPNPSVNFQCIYGATGEYCEEELKVACGSCQTVTFFGVNPDLEPYINYSDTCQNIDQIQIESACY